MILILSIISHGPHLTQLRACTTFEIVVTTLSLYSCDNVIHRLQKMRATKLLKIVVIVTINNGKSDGKVKRMGTP
jgi:hypothetical protein